MDLIPTSGPGRGRRRSIARAGTVCVAVAAVGALVVSCSSSSSSTSSPSQPANGSRGSSSGGSSGGPNTAAGLRDRAAASGLIASVAATSIEVQSTTAQNTVNYTATTTFTQERAVARSAITVGSCIVASGTSSGSSLAATNVQVVAAANGACTQRFGGGAPGGRSGARPSGAARPSGSAMPSGAMPGGGARPSGVPSGARAGGGFVTGKVTAVAGSVLTVRSLGGVRSGLPFSSSSSSASSSSASSSGASSSSASSSGASSSAASTRTVVLSAKTTITSTAKVTRKALKTGLCAAAYGKTDTKGAVAATRIALSTAVSGQCTAAARGGFGRGGFGPGGSRQGGSGGAGQPSGSNG